MDLIKTSLTLQFFTVTNTKKELLMKIIKDDDVQFWWSTVAYDIDNVPENTDLLHTIVDLWITIRGGCNYLHLD